MARYTGPARITFSGDERIAKLYIAEARKYLGALFASNNVPHLSRRLVNADGVAFEVQVVAGQPQMHIDARKYAKDGRKYATILYYFDTAADLLRGIDVDTGVQVAAVSGFTAMSAMALHPNNKWLFCTASVGAANYDNIFINLSLLSAAAFPSPVLSTAIRPNNRVAWPSNRRISPDGAHLLTAYERTADPVTQVVIEGFGVFCVFNIAEQPSGLPLYSMTTVIERGQHPGTGPLPMAFISNTEALLYVGVDTDAAATPVEPGPTETVYGRVRRVSVAGVNNGVVNYGTGEYEPGFHPGVYARDMKIKSGHAYVTFYKSAANTPAIPPYSVPDNRDLEIIDLASGAVGVGGLNVVPISVGASATQGVLALRNTTTVVTIQANNAIQRINASDPTAPTLVAQATISHTAGNAGAAYCNVGPKLGTTESEDNRIFISYALSAGGYEMLIFRPESVSGMENGGTITPYKAISMPGFSGARESVVLKRELRQAYVD